MKIVLGALIGAALGVLIVILVSLMASLIDISSPRVFGAAFVVAIAMCVGAIAASGDGY